MTIIHVYHPVGSVVNAVEGDPPVDQSSLVASLQSQVTALTTERDAALSANTALQAKITAARAAAEATKAADAATVDGQSVLDALA
jgi:hypothetical protein